MAAVFKKFGDDQAGQLAALISYYGFVSLFPLLLVFVTILGFVLQGDPDEQKRILDGTLGQFPIIRDQLKLHSLTGSAAALAIGVVARAAGGHGHHRRHAERLQPHLARARTSGGRTSSTPRLRGLGMLGMLGTLSIVSDGRRRLRRSSSHPRVHRGGRRGRRASPSTSRCS